MNRLLDLSRFEYAGPPAAASDSCCRRVVDASAARYFRPGTRLPILNLAVRDACENGAVVWIPPNTRVYVFPPLVLPRGGLSILGAGVSSEVAVYPTFHEPDDGAPVALFEAGGGEEEPGPVGSPLRLEGLRLSGLKNLRLDHNDYHNYSAGKSRRMVAVRVLSCSFPLHVRDVFIHNFEGERRSFSLTGKPLLLIERTGAAVEVIDSCAHVCIEALKVRGCNVALALPGPASTPFPCRVSLVYSDLNFCSSALVLCANGGADVSLCATRLDGAAGPALVVTDAAALRIRGCRFEGNWSEDKNAASRPSDLPWAVVSPAELAPYCGDSKEWRTHAAIDVRRCGFFSFSGNYTNEYHAEKNLRVEPGVHYFALGDRLLGTHANSVSLPPRTPEQVFENGGGMVFSTDQDATFSEIQRAVDTTRDLKIAEGCAPAS